MKQTSKKTRCFFNWNSNPQWAFTRNLKPRRSFKRSRIINDTSRKKSSNEIIEARIVEHNEKMITNDNPITHKQASLEMLIGRKKDDIAFVKSQVWC